jgi:hypothetical protein
LTPGVMLLRKWMSPGVMLLRKRLSPSWSTKDPSLRKMRRGLRQLRSRPRSVRRKWNRPKLQMPCKSTSISLRPPCPSTRARLKRRGRSRPPDHGWSKPRRDHQHC